MLAVEGLSKSFGGVAAIQDVTLEFAPGSLTAIIGPNGAGKTTFFNLVSGAIRPDRGRVTLSGKDIVGLPPKASVVSSNLSHGDQKLLDIGLALVLEPRVLLLDEPTAGMGPEERWQMIKKVHELWERQNITLVFIEHDMDIVF